MAHLTHSFQSSSNDEYLILAADRHPALLGASGAEGWSEIWDSIGPLAAKVMQGETVSYTDHFLALNLHGLITETYHVWAFVPFRDRNGVVLGYHNPSFETTSRVIAERRLATLRELSSMTASARTTKGEAFPHDHAPVSDLQLTSLCVPQSFARRHWNASPAMRTTSPLLSSTLRA